MTDALLPARKGGLLSATLALSLATLLTRLVTFVTQVIIAYRFGAGLEADAFFAAEHTILIVSDFIVIGFTAAFIPAWMNLRAREGEQAARQIGGAFVTLATGFTVVLAVLMALGAPLLVKVVAPGFSGRAADLTARLLAIMGVSIAFLGYTAGCTSMLEAHRRFLVPEFSRVAYRIVVLLGLIVLADRLGIMVLAWGTLLGGAVRLVVQLPASREINMVSLTRPFLHPAVRRVGRQLLPIFIGYAGLRITMQLGNAIASGLSEGSVAALSYAVRVTLLPVGLLALPLRTTIFPTLSEHVAEGRLEKMGETALRGIRSLCFIAVPVSAGLILLRVPLIQLLLQRGAFDSGATQLTAGVMAWLATSLPAIGGLMIVNSVFFSLSEPEMLVRLNLAGWLLTLGLGLGLVGPYGPMGIAAAVAVSLNATFLLALLTLKRRLPGLKIRLLSGTVIKALAAAACMVGFLALLSARWTGALTPGLEAPARTLLAGLLLSTVAGGLVYALAALGLRMDEARMLFHLVSKPLRRRRVEP